MSVLIRPIIAGLLLYGLLHAVPAMAGSGRLTFSGAIVVPTCATLSTPTVAEIGDATSDRAFTCGGRAQTATHANAASYRLSQLSLDGETIGGSQLLRYFVGYRASMHAADAKMLTRTYE